MEIIQLTEWSPFLANLKWPVVVALMAQILFIAVTGQVGMARYRYRIFPPKTTGHPDFDRIFRVHMNFVEQFPFFALALLLCTFVVSGQVAGILGSIWVLFRALYSVRYSSRPIGKDIYLYTAPQYLALFLMYLFPAIRVFSG